MRYLHLMPSIDSRDKAQFSTVVPVDEQVATIILSPDCSCTAGLDGCGVIDHFIKLDAVVFRGHVPFTVL